MYSIMGNYIVSRVCTIIIIINVFSEDIKFPLQSILWTGLLKSVTV